MYEQSARWNEYYREPEPRRRKEQLDILCMTEPDDGANEYRRMLFKARHVDEKQPGHEVDRFLFNCLSFAQLWASAKLFKKHWSLFSYHIMKTESQPNFPADRDSALLLPELLSMNQRCCCLMNRLELLICSLEGRCSWN